MDKIIEKWDEILNTVKQEYEISDVSFDTWIRPLEIFAIEGNTLYILVPSEQMALSYISKKYLAPLRVAIVEITEIEYEIKFILPEEARTLKLNTKPAKATPAVTADESNLNPNYTFDTFVVGNNNRFAHSASLAVAESPGEAYNPLYIYGGPLPLSSDVIISMLRFSISAGFTISILSSIRFPPPVFHIFSSYQTSF